MLFFLATSNTDYNLAWVFVSREVALDTTMDEPQLDRVTTSTDAGHFWGMCAISSIDVVTKMKRYMTIAENTREREQLAILQETHEF